MPPNAAKTLELSWRASSGRLPVRLDPEQLLEDAILKGFKYISLHWIGATHVLLPVEDDVMFVAMACDELPAALLEGRTQRVVLGDGLISIVASLVDDVVKVTTTHTEHLDRRFQSSVTVDISREAYLLGWKGLAAQLAEQISLAEYPGDAAEEK